MRRCTHRGGARPAQAPWRSRFDAGTLSTSRRRRFDGWELCGLGHGDAADRLREAPGSNLTSPLTASIASLVWPGLGQLLLGQSSKGWLLVVLGFLTCGLLGVLNVLAAWDAAVLAGRQASEGRALEPWETTGGLRLLKNAALFVAEMVTSL